eukprot:gene10970-biopygen9305
MIPLCGVAIVRAATFGRQLWRRADPRPRRRRPRPALTAPSTRFADSTVQYSGMVRYRMGELLLVCQNASSQASREGIKEAHAFLRTAACRYMVRERQPHFHWSGGRGPTRAENFLRGGGAGWRMVSLCQ